MRADRISTSAENQLLPRHRWYVFKEGFSPALLDLAAPSLPARDKIDVIDPFCGSGTVPLAGRMRGWNSVGVELNPFSAFVSETKLISEPPDTLDRYLSNIERGIRLEPKSRLEGVSTFAEDSKKEKWLFNRSVLRAFEGGWRAAGDVKNGVSGLFRLALIGAAMDNCNAVRDGKCLRYKPDWKNLAFDATRFTNSFHDRINQMRADLSHDLPLGGDATIIKGDVRQVEIPRQFDVCITSPPYLNSFDYSDVYRPEMFLGGFVANNQDLMGIRLKTVRSHLQADWAQPNGDDVGVIASEVMEQLKARQESLWSSRIPQMVQAYCEDMARILSRLGSKARPGAIAWIIVSTSAYAGIEVPVDLIIGEIATRAGWRLKGIQTLRQMRTSSQNYARWAGKPTTSLLLRESAVVIEWPHG